MPCSTTGPLTAALGRACTRGPGLVTLEGVDHLLHPDGTPVNTQVLARPRSPP